MQEKSIFWAFQQNWAFSVSKEGEEFFDVVGSRLDAQITRGGTPK